MTASGAVVPHTEQVNFPDLLMSEPPSVGKARSQSVISAALLRRFDPDDRWGIGNRGSCAFRCSWTPSPWPSFPPTHPVESSSSMASLPLWWRCSPRCLSSRAGWSVELAARRLRVSIPEAGSSRPASGGRTSTRGIGSASRSAGRRPSPRPRGDREGSRGVHPGQVLSRPRWS